MKKGFAGTGTVERVEFPNKGIVITDDGEKVIVKNTIPGQKVEFVVNKVKHKKAEGRLMKVVERSPIETEKPCPHFGACGGCTYQTVAFTGQKAHSRCNRHRGRSWIRIFRDKGKSVKISIQEQDGVLIRRRVQRRSAGPWNAQKRQFL